MIQKIQPFSRNALLTAFQTQAFAHVPSLLTPDVIPTAVEHFFRFLALPQSVKEQLTYKHTPGRRGGRAGYKRSEPEPPKDPDGKELFQFHPSMSHRMNAERTQYPELDALLTSGEQIYTASCAIVQKLTQAFEQDAPGLMERFFPADEDPFIHVRFLKYDRVPENDGAFMAVGHYDIGDLTIAFGASAPGLRGGGDIGSPLEPMTDIVHRAGTAALFPSWNLPKDIPGIGIVPLWHEVVQRPEHAWNSDTARWAIVAFADTHGGIAATWEESHTRRGSAPNEPLTRLA